MAVDSGRELWRTRPLRGGVTELAWSPDGSRLLVATAGPWLLLGRDGLLLSRRSLPAGFVADDFAWSPDGRRVAVVRRNERRSEVVLVGPRGRARPLFTGSGRFGSVAFSPDGRRLLVPWPGADQWLFLSTAPGGRIAAVANIGRQFAAGPRGGPFPDAVEWCCADQNAFANSSSSSPQPPSAPTFSRITAPPAWRSKPRCSSSTRVPPSCGVKRTSTSVALPGSGSNSYSGVRCQARRTRRGGSHSVTKPQSHSWPSASRSNQRPPANGSITTSTAIVSPM